VKTPPRIPPRIITGAISAHTDDFSSFLTLAPEKPSDIA